MSAVRLISGWLAVLILARLATRIDMLLPATLDPVWVAASQVGLAVASLGVYAATRRRSGAAAKPARPAEPKPMPFGKKGTAT